MGREDRAGPGLHIPSFEKLQAQSHGKIRIPENKNLMAFTLELESVMRRRGEIEAIVAKAEYWTFPTTLTTELRHVKTVRRRWIGFAAFGLLKEPTRYLRQERWNEMVKDNLAFWGADSDGIIMHPAVITDQTDLRDSSTHPTGFWTDSCKLDYYVVELKWMRKERAARANDHTYSGPNLNDDNHASP